MAIIPSSHKKYLYVKINGIIMKHTSRLLNETNVTPVRCGSRNRIMIHTALYSAAICPYTSSYRHNNLVEVFSEGWAVTTVNGRPALTVDKVDIDRLGGDVSRAIVVEFLGREAASYSVMWLELSRR